ncbi:Bacteriophage HK97-gp10, putative tail-component [uncultured Caudovirales phage]|uniref:Bacteriophage HK97-gp10, putative tail-component n=1 Tax=uncultured Caudovirales phage TaxID=2100421 RepID=A0A6J5KMS3_9CAUD|nr:Bacteriophage HK97-gp10, putative tail-component [uncultured Caudovirales phage]CAB4123590.1 Bacteriophage HK97-gp10, putative tail-component [uncultured Caudovirales phage]CAB5218836.1 Bacteriophage HK97-gp10, putative tail-component [uncultured Caudovirales phage]
MGIKLDTDIDSLIAILSQTGEYVRKGVAKKMVEGGVKMRDKAKDYAPVDEGNLEDAITVQHDRAGINGRTKVYVFVDESHPVDNRDGHTVGEYAMRMHEGSYNLGEKSLAKQAGLGVTVGPKYLERAADDTTSETVSSMLSEARHRLLIEGKGVASSIDSEYDDEEY